MESFEAYIAERRKKLLNQRKRIDDQLRELDITERHWRASAGKASRGGVTLDSSEDETTEPTIKDRVVSLLERSEDGLTALEILEALQMQGMTSLTRTSLSPQLSRLKKDEIVHHDETSGRWSVSKVAHEEEDFLA
jgi:hypothetical protein